MFDNINFSLGEVLKIAWVQSNCAPMLLRICFCLLSLSSMATKKTFDTTLQSIMNAKLGLHGFWHCHENGLIKTIQMILHNLHVSFKSTSLYCGLRLILVYPNP